ncbi:unnamed protein product, partial [Symbiodinium sp. CCMP2456]
MASFWEQPDRHRRGIEALLADMPKDAVEELSTLLQEQGIEACSPQDFLSTLPTASMHASTLALVRKLRDHAVQAARQAEASSFEEWLARPFERLKYWAELWRAQGRPPPHFSELRRQAVAQARQLPAVTGQHMYRYIRSMPNKAPGLDGWDVPFLKALTREEVSTLAELWRAVELEGALPHPSSFTQYVMLPKNDRVERPIGLMSTLVKLGMKCRWELASRWIESNRAALWWDSALPSRSTHDASLRRAFLYEACRVDKVHRCTIFFDLSTFYERVSHERLVEEAAAWQFPPLLLNLGMEAYRGGRIVTSDSVASPCVYATRGIVIVAGCPLAPTVSKLAIGKPI